MKIYRLIFSALIAFLIIEACGKKDKEHPTYYLGQRYKDYAVYKVGSYWIYEDSASKVIDSIYLYKQEISINDGGGIVPFNSEGIYENRYSSLYNDTLLCNGGIVSDRSGAIYRVARLNDYFNSNIDYFEGLIGQLAPGTFYSYYIDKKDSIVFNNQKFFDVDIFENTQQEYSYQPRRTYYAKHVGLVRKELFNGEVWNLIRYQVSQ